MKTLKILFILAILFHTSCKKNPLPDASPLKCNYSSADISTLEGEQVSLAGFSDRKELSTGIHLKIRTYCLVITDGQQKVCIVNNDLMETSPALASEIRDRIAVQTGLDRKYILLNNLHTHSAPRVTGTWAEPDGPNYAYKLRTVETIVANAVNTIKDDKAFREFSLEVGKTTTDILGNRCEKEGPVDTDVYAARFVSKDGKPICAIINLACHPVCMGPKSLLLSSDYSGYARKELAKKWGCEVFQLTGAAGNMDPAKGPQTYEYAEQCGSSLYLSLSNIVFFAARKDGTLKLFHNVSHLPYAIPEVTKEAVIAHAEAIKHKKTQFKTFEEDVERWKKQILDEWDLPGKNYKSLDFDMTALNINGVIFFFSQGEPFCEYQMEARSTFKREIIFFAGYTNGQNAYLASKRGYQVRTGYEYEIELMHIYTKSPYPLSETMPDVYQASTTETISKVL
ncbi:MAG: neutral/alkaline non-lysosomal ceramidase N-terminal domain-containing protein [Alistipes sp.]|nr:neutral/alkaline non-lysosomal ceramidase N-terminal domain-containing protein [Candidatus Alistipes equi]